MRTKWCKNLCKLTFSAAVLMSLTMSARAADYSFTTDAPQDYYKSSPYEEVYGSQCNYGGPNIVDYQTPELEYGIQSTTQTGVMERTILPGLQEAVATVDGTGYGISDGGGTAVTLPDLIVTPTVAQTVYQPPAYTSADGMTRADGSIGTVSIPSLGISMKVWEGETNASMAKGMGHYSATSAWDGNVSVCGHNRGAKYVIGSIKDLKQGDIITYTTIYGRGKCVSNSTC